MNPEKKEVIDKRNILLRKLILAKLSSIRKEKFEPKTIDKLSLTFRVFLLRYLNLNYEFTLEELINELNKTKISSKLRDEIIEIMSLLTEIEYEDRKISREEFKSVLSGAENVVNIATGIIEKKEKIVEKGKEKVPVKKRVLFNFLHKISLAKTEKEREAIKKIRLKKKKERQRLDEIKKQERLKAKEERIKQIEIEKKRKALEKKRTEEEGKREEEKKIKEREEKIVREEKRREEETKRQKEEWEKKKLSFLKRKEPVILPPPLPFPDLKAAGLDEIEKKKKGVKIIKEDIHKARIMLNESKLNDAKRVYIGIMKIYISLEPEDQVEVYNDIKKLYFERKNKEKRKGKKDK